MTASLNLPVNTDVSLTGCRLPRLVLQAECTTCGRLCANGSNESSIPELALTHTVLTGHIVVLNGTTDLPEDEDHEGDQASPVSAGQSENGDKTFYVDLPTEDCIGNEDGVWKNVTTCSTFQEAIAFAQKNFGADEHGRVCLVTG